jgi:transposase
LRLGELGEKIANPRHWNKHYKRLRKVQKVLSGKHKGSRNRDKAVVKVAKIHASIRDSRKDFLSVLALFKSDPIFLSSDPNVGSRN